MLEINVKAFPYAALRNAFITRNKLLFRKNDEQVTFMLHIDAIETDEHLLLYRP